jgi:hypothetical protein
VDQARFEELKEKAAGPGLTADEADELGRLYAEEAGKPYANARDVEHVDELTTVVPEDEELIRHAEESGTLDDKESHAPDLRPASPATLGELEAEEGLQHTPDDVAEEDEGERA